MALFLVSRLSALADDVNGSIKTSTGETLVVKTDVGNDVTVVLTEATNTVDKRSLFGLDKDQLGDIVLIPGLKVSLEGSPDDQGRFVAKEIIIDGDDLATSGMIQAGLHPTEEQVAKNVETLATHKEQLGSHEQMIAANQQQIRANKQQIQQSLSSIEEHTRRFRALDDFDVKGLLTTDPIGGNFCLEV